MPIQFIGLKSLSAEELTNLQRVTKTELPKIERILKNAKVIIDIKGYEKDGARAKFSLHARLECPSLLMTAEADSWEIATAAHKIFDKLVMEMQHKFKTEFSAKKQ